MVTGTTYSTWVIRRGKAGLIIGVTSRYSAVSQRHTRPDLCDSSGILARMEQELNFRIVLVDPPPGVDYGLQKGGGNDYEVVQKQRSKSGDLKFEFSARVKEGKDGQPVLLGPFTQGPADGRFAYLDIGTYAGQTDTPWSRRLKIPFRDITWDVVKKASKRILETRVPGKGKDGSPSCATVKPFGGWKVV